MYSFLKSFELDAKTYYTYFALCTCHDINDIFQKLNSNIPKF